MLVSIEGLWGTNYVEDNQQTLKFGGALVVDSYTNSSVKYMSTTNPP